MKITQKGRQILADFTDIENQYSDGTIEIPVVLSDTEFNGYSMYFSAQMQNYESYNYIARLVDGNKIVLPLAVTYYSGTLTISLYGIKGNLTKTTNNIAFNIIESNPTADQIKPTSTDWAQAVKEYTDAYAAERIAAATPSINKENKHWYIGKVDTGVVAEGHADIPVATTSSLGGVVVGDGLTISSSKLSVATSYKKAFTLSASSWSGGQYTITDSHITSTSNQECIPNKTINVDQYDALMSAKIIDGGQTTGSLVLKALGDVPQIDIPIEIIFRGNV